MIKTDEFGGVTVGGTLDSLFAEYASAGSQNLTVNHYKLQAMSNLAVTFDRKIEKSLRKRFKIWSSLSTNVADREVWRDIDIKFTRNLPKNLQEEAQTASQLEGIVSKETQLSVLSIVPDVKKEIEKMEEEEEEQMQQLSMYQQTMGAVNGENNAGNISSEDEGEPGLLAK